MVTPVLASDREDDFRDEKDNDHTPSALICDHSPTRPEDTESEETYLDATRVPATFWVEVAALASVRVAVNDGDDQVTLKVLQKKA